MDRSQPNNTPNDNQETQACPTCGAVMPALRGSKASVCKQCGYKESCCY